MRGGNAWRERLDEMAQSPGAGALRGEGDGVERAERCRRRTAPAPPGVANSTRAGRPAATISGAPRSSRSAKGEPATRAATSFEFMTARSAASMGGEAISFGEIGLAKGRNDANGDPASMLTKSLTLSLAFRPCRERRLPHLTVKICAAPQNHIALQQKIGYVAAIKAAPISGAKGEEHHGQRPV